MAEKGNPKGPPYQTHVSCIIHQFSKGTLAEAEDLTQLA
jgi:hypothetical protein